MHPSEIAYASDVAADFQCPMRNASCLGDDCAVWIVVAADVNGNPFGCEHGYCGLIKVPS